MRRNKVLYLMLVALTVLFSVGIFSLLKPQEKAEKAIVVDNGEEKREWNVLFEQPKVLLFRKYHQIINQFPDRIIIHEPYLVVVMPGDRERTSTVYSLTLKQEEAIYRQILLDYTPSNLLTTDNQTTFFNDKDLKMYCSHGFILNAETVLCLTPKADDPLDNKIVSINPTTGKTTDYYSSHRLIQSFAVINNTLYVGEQDLETKQSYLRIDEKDVEIPTQADIIYPMGERIYYATLKSNTLGREGSYSLIEQHDDIIIIDLIEKGRIVFN